jgi:hypothetical protein
MRGIECSSCAFWRENATVPLQDGKLAAEVLNEAIERGFAGVMVGTLPKGEHGGNLDDPSLDPFWETAARLGAAVVMHPMFVCGEPRASVSIRRLAVLTHGTAPSLMLRPSSFSPRIPTRVRVHSTAVTRADGTGCRTIHIGEDARASPISSVRPARMLAA